MQNMFFLSITTETSVIRSPPVLALHIHVDQYETLGLFIRGGKEHGLAIYVSEVEPHSAAGTHQWFCC